MLPLLLPLPLPLLLLLNKALCYPGVGQRGLLVTCF